MIGMRRLSARLRGRHVLVASVLALLALAVLPVLAQADSSGIQYEDATPTATTHGHEIPSGSGGSPAHSSGTHGGGSGSGESSGSGGSSEGGSSKEGESAAGGPAKNGGDGGNGAKPQGNPGKGAKNHRASGAKPTAKNAAEKDEGGGSSPLVPILIAIAVLAAVSVAVVAYRQRRRRDAGSDARVSPEAS